MTEQSETALRPVRAPSEPWFEACFVCAGVALQLGGWARYFATQPGVLEPLIGGVLGWLAADALSGLMHFLADNFGSARTPVFGRTVISTFRDHHASPKRMLDHGFLERNGWNFAGGGVIALPCVALPDAGGLWMPVALSTSFLLSCTNQIHAWAHHPSPPRWVTLLQSCGLLLRPRAHARHHAPFERCSGATNYSAAPRRPVWAKLFTEHYCITSGFWDRSFRLLTALKRGEPSRPSVACPRAIVGTLPNRRD